MTRGARLELRQVINELEELETSLDPSATPQATYEGLAAAAAGLRRALSALEATSRVDL